MERVHKFGGARNLLGIYAQAEKVNDKGTDLGIVLLNSGLVHRAGPFRIHTELSRHLNQKGYNVFRFDVSGVGDSEITANDSRAYKERFIEDIGEAIDFLKRQYHINRIVVFGLCTGADLAHTAAVRFPQVVGGILLDGYGYPSWRFLLRRYGPVLSNPARLTSAVVKLTARLFKPAGQKLVESGMDDFFWILPDKKAYIEEMQNLHQRGVRQLYVYTGGIKHYYNYHNQFQDCFRQYEFANDVQVSYLEHVDHTFILMAYREHLFELVTQWLDRQIISC